MPRDIDASVQASGMRPGVFGAITLDQTGGGVATASRLMWQAFQDTWPDCTRLVTLRAGTSTQGRPALSERVRFGLRIGAAQVLRASDWTFFSHLAVAQVQSFIPAGLRRPYAVFLHGIEVWRPLAVRQTSVLRQASLLVANSDFTAKRAAAVHPWLGDIAVCPLALPPNALADAGDAMTSDRIAPVVLTVGRLDPEERYKGHDELLAAWPHVCARVPGARLIIVGDGADAPRLREVARAHGVSHAVEFAGFVSADRLDELYRGAKVFAMPSRNEGFGLVYLEAMRHGLPCIGSIHDAATGVIEDGVTGRLVDQSDVPMLAETVAHLLLDGEACRRMGRAGAARLADRFSYPMFRARFVELVANGLATRQRGKRVSQAMTEGVEKP